MEMADSLDKQAEQDEHSENPTPPKPARIWWRAAIIAGIALLLLPDLVWLDGWSPFAQAVTFRPLVMPILLILGLALSFRRSLQWIGLSLAIISLTAFIPLFPRTQGSPSAEEAPRLNVLAINVAVSQASIPDVAKLINDRHADLISLPEADENYRVQLEKALEGRYTGVSQQFDDSSVTATSVLVRSGLGDVHHELSVDSTFPAWVISGGKLGNLKFVAFHAFPPIPLSTDKWREDLNQLPQWCTQDIPLIIAGDFNASLDHSRFRSAIDGCTDSAENLGEGLTGTWPATQPSWLGVQIDHIVYRSGPQPRSVSFIDVPGTDHRAVHTEFVLPEAR